jgi:hypothetical protein
MIYNICYGMKYRSKSNPRRGGGTSGTANRAPGSTPPYVCLLPAQGSVGCDCLIPWFLWDQYRPQKIYRKEI